MRKSLALTVAACALLGLTGGAATASAHTPALKAAPAATAQADPGDPNGWSSDPRVDPLTCRNYYIQIGYAGERFTEKDWYGLYTKTPNPDNWRDGLVDQQWQWAKNGANYLTGIQYGKYTTAYWTWNDDTQKYDLVSAERLQSIDCRTQ
ncbi:hypothetical protein ACFWJ4_21740 [Kitasatospora sp. NPDC127067]|uniref:hypothetical protein n=1 Tax=Kitasatospora sp. NPDC127067 TaxID=3347126 RepID=UPI0036666972